MEKIELKTREGFYRLCNHLEEKYIDYINDNVFVFEKGTVYGLIGEHGSGGEMVCSLLSGRIELNDNAIWVDGKKEKEDIANEFGWYVGKREYAQGLIKKEVSVRKALDNAVKKCRRFRSVQEIAEEFHLTQDRLDYEISKYSGERLRASLAIGYASDKKVYCFPWMNSLYFYDSILSSGVFRFFEKLKSEGCIIILPTSRVENVKGLVDAIIEIDNPRFRNVICDSEYFKECNMNA